MKWQKKARRQVNKSSLERCQMVKQKKRWAWFSFAESRDKRVKLRFQEVGHDDVGRHLHTEVTQTSGTGVAAMKQTKGNPQQPTLEQVSVGRKEGGGRSLVTLHNWPVTGPQQQHRQQQLQTWKRKRMRYWRVGHAVRLFTLLPSYLIPVWACLSACICTHAQVGFF